MNELILSTSDGWRELLLTLWEKHGKHIENELELDKNKNYFPPSN